LLAKKKAEEKEKEEKEAKERFNTYFPAKTNKEETKEKAPK
jgi:hypothetical protein